MPKKALLYCLKVWVTGLIVGPLVFYVMDNNDLDGLFSFPEYIFMSFVAGLVLSIPSFLLLWATATYICKRPGYPPLKRFKLTECSLLLTALPAMAMFAYFTNGWANPEWSLTIRLIASYFIPIAAAIFFYRLPAGPQDAQDHPAADRPEADRPKAITRSANSSPD